MSRLLWLRCGTGVSGETILGTGGKTETDVDVERWGKDGESSRDPRGSRRGSESEVVNEKERWDSSTGPTEEE